MNDIAQTRSLNIRYALLHATAWGTHCALLSFATLFLLGLGFSNATVGVIIALSNILGVFAQPWAAALARRIGTARLIALLSGIGVLLGGCMLTLGAVPLVAAVLIMPLIMVLHCILGPINALSMEYVNRGFYVNYGLGRGVGSLGFAIVSFLLGSAAQRFGVSIIPLIYTTMLFATALLALSFRLPRTATSGKAEHGGNEPPLRAARSVLGLMTHYKGFTIIWFSYLCVMMGGNTVSTFMISIMTARGAAGGEMGAALALGALLELPAMALFAMLMRRFSTGKLLRFASVFLTVKIVALLLTSTVGGVFAAQMLQPLGYALFIPATVYYTNKALCPEDRLLGQTLMMAANTLASVVGSFCGGFLLDAGGTTFLLVACLGVSAIGTVFTFVGARGSDNDSAAKA